MLSRIAGAFPVAKRGPCPEISSDIIKAKGESLRKQILVLKLAREEVKDNTVEGPVILVSKIHKGNVVMNLPTPIPQVV